jgi:maltose O-acetyltransferase
MGDRVWIGPNVIISATTHSTLASQRRKHVGGTWGKSITIGNDVWIGGNSVVMHGVTIGSGAVIGCNSVVTNDIPGSCIAVGTPAKVIKHLEHTPEIPEAILQAILNPTLAKL